MPAAAADVQLLEAGALSPKALSLLGACSLDTASLQCAEPDWAAAAAIRVTRRVAPSAAHSARALNAVQVLIAACATTAAILESLIAC